MEQNETYYNAGDIANYLEEIKQKLFAGNNLVVQGREERDLEQLVKGLSMVGEASAKLSNAVRHFQKVMAPENHHKILTALEEMIDVEEE